MFVCCKPQEETVWTCPVDRQTPRCEEEEAFIDNDAATENTDYRALDRNVDSELCPPWMNDSESKVCLQCKGSFTATNRRTHWYVVLTLILKCFHNTKLL